MVCTVWARGPRLQLLELLCFQPARHLQRKVGQHAIGTGALEREQGFEDGLFLIKPAVLNRITLLVSPSATKESRTDPKVKVRISWRLPGSSLRITVALVLPLPVPVRGDSSTQLTVGSLLQALEALMAGAVYGSTIFSSSSQCC
jgi:hypothetical protein